jgi:hypothetical protein
MLPLFDRQIPHETGMPTVLQQHRLLRRRRLKTIPGHPNNLTTTTDKTADPMQHNAAYPPHPDGQSIR